MKTWTVTMAPLAFVIVFLPKTAYANQNPCSHQSKVIFVQAQEKHLYLCQDGKAAGVYRVSLGRGGMGKQAYQDLKTPVGRYALGVPRDSERFHLFIPIGYPTAEQKKQGYSGQDIGIHGPARYFKWAGRLNTLFNWTEGCLAVGSDQEIEAVASWVRRVQVKTIDIRNRR